MNKQNDPDPMFTNIPMPSDDLAFKFVVDQFYNQLTIHNRQIAIFCAEVSIRGIMPAGVNLGGLTVSGIEDLIIIPGYGKESFLKINDKIITHFTEERKTNEDPTWVFRKAEHLDMIETYAGAYSPAPIALRMMKNYTTLTLMYSESGDNVSSNVGSPDQLRRFIKDVTSKNCNQSYRAVIRNQDIGGHLDQRLYLPPLLHINESNPYTYDTPAETIRKLADGTSSRGLSYYPRLAPDASDNAFRDSQDQKIAMDSQIYDMYERSLTIAAANRTMNSIGSDLSPEYPIITSDYVTEWIRQQRDDTVRVRTEIEKLLVSNDERLHLENSLHVRRFEHIVSIMMVMVWCDHILWKEPIIAKEKHLKYAISYVEEVYRTYRIAYTRKTKDNISDGVQHLINTIGSKDFKLKKGVKCEDGKITINRSELTSICRSISNKIRKEEGCKLVEALDQILDAATDFSPKKDIVTVPLIKSGTSIYTVKPNFIK